MELPTVNQTHNMAPEGRLRCEQCGKLVNAGGLRHHRTDVHGSPDRASRSPVVGALGGEPQGSKLVPLEPTREMLDAGADAAECPRGLFEADLRCIWRDMLSAARPPAGAPAKEKALDALHILFNQAGQQRPVVWKSLHSFIKGASAAEPAPLKESWRPIATAPKAGGYLWLANANTIRIGWWMSGAEHEAHGSKGGGWKDMALSEACAHPRDLPYAPTHWMPLPAAPGVSPTGSPEGEVK